MSKEFIVSEINSELGQAKGLNPWKGGDKEENWLMLTDVAILANKL
jgi:hypothetical protein